MSEEQLQKLKVDVSKTAVIVIAREAVESWRWGE